MQTKHNIISQNKFLETAGQSENGSTDGVREPFHVVFLRPGLPDSNLVLSIFVDKHVTIF